MNVLISYRFKSFKDFLRMKIHLKIIKIDFEIFSFEDEVPAFEQISLDFVCTAKCFRKVLLIPTLFHETTGNFFDIECLARFHEKNYIFELISTSNTLT